MKTLTRNQFLKIPPDKRKQFLGYLVRSDDEYEIYEAGEAKKYKEALAKYKEERESETPMKLEPTEKQQVIMNAEVEMYKKELLEGKPLNIKKINVLLKDIYANNLLR